MERMEFAKSFSKRLQSLPQNERDSSNKSRSGINISELAKVAGVSYQMARKYTLGLAMPDYYIIPKIAKWLNVSPGWLLFGENDSAKQQKQTTLIEIESNLLKHILQKCTVLFPKTDNSDKIANYIADVIYDLAQINADNRTIIKFLDMMLSSAIQFGSVKKEHRA